MSTSLTDAANIPVSEASAVVTYSPVVFDVPGRPVPLEIKVSMPESGSDLPLILLSHGHGMANFLSSLNGYGPLVNFWAAHGFVVIQPTFLDSKTLSANPIASHGEAVKAYLGDPRKLDMWRYCVEDVKRTLDQLDVIEDSWD